MTQPYRTIGLRDGGRYLLEATTEIRQAEGGDWRHAPDRPPRYCRPGESTAYDYAILREMCKLEAPEGYELVNDGVEAFKAQKGDKSFINAKWCSNGVGNTVRAPVCRPVALIAKAEGRD